MPQRERLFTCEGRADAAAPTMQQLTKFQGRSAFNLQRRRVYSNSSTFYFGLN